jgi:hypothetical protein
MQVVWVKRGQRCACFYGLADAQRPADIPLHRGTALHAAIPSASNSPSAGKGGWNHKYHALHQGITSAEWCRGWTDWTSYRRATHPIKEHLPQVRTGKF